MWLAQLLEEIVESDDTVPLLANGSPRTNHAVPAQEQMQPLLGADRPWQQPEGMRRRLQQGQQQQQQRQLRARGNNEYAPVPQVYQEVPAPPAQDPGRALLQLDSQMGVFVCCNCCVSVPQDKWVGVEKFGAFVELLAPGLNFVGFDCCCCCIKFPSLTSRVAQLTFNVNTKTSDHVFVTVEVSVQQAVQPESVMLAMYKLEDVAGQVEAYVADVLRSEVPTITLDEAFEQKDRLSMSVQERLREVMAQYGFVIHKVLVVEVVPAPAVAEAMNQISQQKRLRDAALQEAEANKVRVVKAAEADSAAAQLKGEGISRQRRAIAHGLRDSIEHATKQKLKTDQLTELLLITQYMDTLRQIASGANATTVFLPQGPEAVADVAEQVHGGVGRKPHSGQAEDTDPPNPRQGKSSGRRAQSVDPPKPRRKLLGV